MYDLKWYNGQPFEYKDGFVSDLSNFMVGMPRFRQLRVKSGKLRVKLFTNDFLNNSEPDKTLFKHQTLLLSIPLFELFLGQSVKPLFFVTF